MGSYMTEDIVVIDHACTFLIAKEGTFAAYNDVNRMWKKVAYHSKFVGISYLKKTRSVRIADDSRLSHRKPDSCSKHIATTSSTQRKHMYHNMPLLS
jgi:hypothetical protein